jgi:membrane protease YdiL (CAAX protease family)
MTDGATRLGAEGAETEPELRARFLEVLVFLALIVPSMLLSFFAVRQGSLGFALTAFATIGRDLGLVGLIAFFLWRNGEAVEVIGWTRANAGKEALLGLGLFALLFPGTGLVENVLRSAGLTAPATPLPRFLTARGPAELALAAVLVTVVAVAEETVFRGYLIHRLTAVTRRPAVAALLSAVIFSLGHGYEGTAGVVTVGVMGLALALVYVWRRSLVAPIVMHFLQDFGGIVLLPLLGRG